jgi:signal transduction histidine kinase
VVLPVDARNEAVSADAANPGARKGLSLSAKLLWLTVAFVMIAEVLVFVPSVSNFRHNWLEERVSAAQIASLAAEAAPDKQLPESLRKELLETAQVQAVALKRDETRRLILAPDRALAIDAHIDLRDTSPVRLILDAFATYSHPEPRTIRVVGQPGFRGGEFIEVVMNEAPLRAAMVQFGLNILGLSIVISLITAALVYFALNALFVAPVRRLSAAMARFGEAPEDPARVVAPSTRGDEIGMAERRLARMQLELAETLNQKTRLATLGLAVAKINHDLRNMLSTAQLLSDRLGESRDPMVQKFAPKLIAALDRAIRLCGDSLKYGAAREAPPRRSRFALRPLAEEVGESLGLAEGSGVRFVIEAPADVEIEADRDQLFRVLSNLARNGRDAVVGENGLGRGEVVLSAERAKGGVAIVLRDTGPGLPEKARAHLFEPFHGSQRAGGTGLGLAIAAELVAAHQGAIALVDNEGGATFEIIIPDQAIDLSRRRRAG